MYVYVNFNTATQIIEYNNNEIKQKLRIKRTKRNVSAYIYLYMYICIYVCMYMYITPSTQSNLCPQLIDEIREFQRAAKDISLKIKKTYPFHPIKFIPESSILFLC